MGYLEDAQLISILGHRELDCPIRKISQGSEKAKTSVETRPCQTQSQVLLEGCDQCQVASIGIRWDEVRQKEVHKTGGPRTLHGGWSSQLDLLTHFHQREYSESDRISLVR